ISIPPTRLAIADTAALSRTSRRAMSLMPSAASAASPFSSTSVAKTLAPSRAKAIADARPMPAAAAVTKARLPFRRSDMVFLPSDFWCHTRALTRVSIFFSKAMDRRIKSGDDRSLVIISGHPDFACDVVVARGEFHTGAGGLLADGRAVDFLPWRLARRIGEAAFGLQFGMASLHLLVGDQNVRGSLIEVDTHAVAGFEDRKAAIGGSFRRGVEDRG